MAVRENIILSVDFEGADLTTKKALTLSRTVKDLGDQKKQLANQIKNLDRDSKTYEQELTKLIGKQNQVNAQLKISKKEYADNERQVINSTRANRAVDGSLEQMTLHLSMAQAQWRKMTLAQQQNSKEGIALKAKIDQLDASVKGSEQSMGVHNRSVGNYGMALSGLTPLMGSFGSQIGMIQGTLTQLKTALATTTTAQGTQAAVTEASTIANLQNATSTVAMSTAQKAMAGSTKLVNTGLKLFKVALISTGIGAIVVAFGSLVAALLSTQKGMDAMNRVTTYLGEIFGTLFGMLQEIGIPIWDALTNVFTIYVNNFKLGYLAIVAGVQQMRIAWNEWTGDAEEAEQLRKELDETKKKIKEVVDETVKASKDIAKAGGEAMDIIASTSDRMAEASKRAGQISNLKEEIALIEITQKKREAQLQLEINSQRTIRKNKSLSDAERRKAEAKEIEATRQLRGIEVDLINKKRTLLEFQAEANDTDNEAKKEIADLEAEALQKQAQLQKDITRITQESNVERKKQQADALKAIEEEKKKKVEGEKQALDQQIKLLELARKLEVAENEETGEERYQNEIDLQNKIQALKLESAKLSNKDTEILEKEHALTLAELKKEELQRIKDVEEEDKKKREKEKAEEDKKKAEAEKTEAEKAKERRDAINQVSIDSAKTVADGILKNQERRLNQETQREIEALNLRKQAGTISEEEFAKLREDIDRKAFQKKKKLDTAQVIINGLVGASKTIANLGFPASLPALVGLGVQTATQVAGIQSQTFADGGFTGTSNQKADHTGQKPVGIVHEKEFVANRKALATPRGLQMANELNSINKNPSLGYYADGGFTSSNINISTDGIERTISKALTDMKVINVATDTAKVDSRVKKIQNKGRI